MRKPLNGRQILFNHFTRALWTLEFYHVAKAEVPPSTSFPSTILQSFPKIIAKQYDSDCSASSKVTRGCFSRRLFGCFHGAALHEVPFSDEATEGNFVSEMLAMLISLLPCLGLSLSCHWELPVATIAMGKVDQMALGSALIDGLHSAVSGISESQTIPTKTASFTEQYTSLDYANPVDEQPDILDNQIKITVATSAALIELVLLFFLFKNTPILYDIERKPSSNVEHFSWMKFISFFGLYSILFSFLLSFWLNNTAPELSFSLFGFCCITIITTVFHHRLKKSHSSNHSQTHTELKAFLALLFPLATLLLTIYFISSVFYHNVFPEMPWPTVLFHIILAMVHVAVRTLDSQIVDSHWVHHFLNKADNRKGSPK